MATTCIVSVRLSDGLRARINSATVEIKLAISVDYAREAKEPFWDSI